MAKKRIKDLPVATGEEKKACFFAIDSEAGTRAIQIDEIGSNAIRVDFELPVNYDVNGTWFNYDTENPPEWVFSPRIGQFLYDSAGTVCQIMGFRETAGIVTVRTVTHVGSGAQIFEVVPPDSLAMEVGVSLEIGGLSRYPGIAAGDSLWVVTETGKYISGRVRDVNTDRDCFRYVTLSVDDSNGSGTTPFPKIWDVGTAGNLSETVGGTATLDQYQFSSAKIGDSVFQNKSSGVSVSGRISEVIPGGFLRAVTLSVDNPNGSDEAYPIKSFATMAIAGANESVSLHVVIGQSSIHATAFIPTGDILLDHLEIDFLVSQTGTGSEARVLIYTAEDDGSANFVAAGDIGNLSTTGWARLTLSKDDGSYLVGGQTYYMALQHNYNGLRLLGTTKQNNLNSRPFVSFYSDNLPAIEASVIPAITSVNETNDNIFAVFNRGTGDAAPVAARLNTSIAPLNFTAKSFTSNADCGDYSRANPNTVVLATVIAASETNYYTVLNGRVYGNGTGTIEL